MNTHSNTGPIVGIDVGGTFTDLVMIDPITAEVKLAKTPTTLDNQATGVLAAIDAAGAAPSTLDLIVHGTTTTTNAVLERKLCKTGIITTMGFRDVLELGRRTRPNAYGMTGDFTPLIPRDLRLDVTERMDASGTVVTPLDAESVRQAVMTLKALGCEALVIHFLHAYANPAHELQAQDIAAEIWPNDHITMGHALLSETREYERGVTAAVNASVQPLLERYLARLNETLGARGYRGEVLVMNGNGGMVSSRLVSREAAKTVMSGPASGVMAAAYTGRRAGVEDILSYDMGGTSTDVALIRGGRPSVSSEIEIEYAMPIHVPMVDVRTVGAGGGSIARVNSAGLLEVGPGSAGADPGPICYGKGGTEPTISDANMLLGRLNTERLNAVEGGVQLAEIAEVFETQLGEPLGLDATMAAEAVIRMANTRMAGAIRMVSLSLGVDPRDLTLFAFGGAGPLHAAALARELGIPRVLIPARPGMTNALGCVVADLRHDFVQTLNTPLDTLDIADLHSVLAAQRRQGEALLGEEKAQTTGIAYDHSVDMQFTGQSHVVRVPLDNPEETKEAIRARFDTVYFERFRVELSGVPVSVVNVNTSVIGERPPIDLSLLIDASARNSEAVPHDHRHVIFEGVAHQTPVYSRDTLPEDVHLSGPAILEQMDTTVLIPPGDTVTGAADGNLFIEIGGTA